MLDYLYLFGGIALLAYFTAFLSFYFSKVYDICMDYKMILWAIRYKVARRAAIAQGGDEAEQLEAAKIKADGIAQSGDYSNGTPAEVMDAAYQRIAHYSQHLKGITCITCISLRHNVYFSIIAAVLLFPIVGWWIVLYFHASFAFMGRLMRL